MVPKYYLAILFVSMSGCLQVFYAAELLVSHDADGYIH